jgi:hypothetical protein
LPEAFGPGKLKKALEEWTKFEPHLYTFDPRTNIAQDKAGKHYTTQKDPKHKH